MEAGIDEFERTVEEGEEETLGQLSCAAQQRAINEPTRTTSLETGDHWIAAIHRVP